MIVSVKFYLIMYKGLYLSKRFNKWTCDINNAKKYDTIGPARQKISVLSQQLDEIPVIMELEATSIQPFNTLEERKRVKDFLGKKKREKIRQEMRYKQLEIEHANKTIEEMKNKLKDLEKK